MAASVTSQYSEAFVLRARKSMQKLTFRDGKLLASTEIECLERSAVADGYETKCKSVTPNPLTISVNYSEDQMCN